MKKQPDLYHRTMKRSQTRLINYLRIGVNMGVMWTEKRFYMFAEKKKVYTEDYDLERHWIFKKPHQGKPEHNGVTSSKF